MPHGDICIQTNMGMIHDAVHEIFPEVPGNIIPWGTQSLTMFDVPLMGVAAAGDELFELFKKPEIVSPRHMTPAEWLPGAESVLSFFFPISETVRISNRSKDGIPSSEWLHARIEGQAFISAFMAELCNWFTAHGIAACVPAQDPRLSQYTAEAGDASRPSFSSNWSERHAAFACGLGTFGLSKGLITKKGMAGRFGSIIVALPLEPTARPYSDPYEYCIRCGACIPRCPIDAITLENGKDNAKCKNWVEKVRKMCEPRYGCGKCQTAVPCEFKNPSK